MGRIKHKTNKGKKKQLWKQQQIRAVVCSKYALCLLSPLPVILCTSFLFKSKPPSFYKQRTTKVYHLYGFKQTMVPADIPVSEAQQRSSSGKKLFQSPHLHWRVFLKPPQLWPSSYESAGSASRWYCKSHTLKRVNLWQQSVWTLICLSLKLVQPTQLSCNFGIN